MKKPIRLVKPQPNGTWSWTSDAIELSNKIFKYFLSLYAKYDDYDEVDLRYLIQSAVDDTVGSAGLKRYVRKVKESNKEIQRLRRQRQQKRKKSRS